MSTNDKSTSVLQDNCLRIRKLSKSVHHEHISEIFGSYGSIKSVEILVDKRNGVSKGIALVSFNSLEDAENAMIYLDGGQIDGSIIDVSFSDLRERNAGIKKETSTKKVKSQRGVEGNQTSGRPPNTLDIAVADGTTFIVKDTTKDIVRDGFSRVGDRVDSTAGNPRAVVYGQQRLERSFFHTETPMDDVFNRQQRVERIEIDRHQKYPRDHTRDNHSSGDLSHSRVGVIGHGRSDGAYGNYGGRSSQSAITAAPWSQPTRNDPVRNGFRDAYTAPRLDGPTSRRADEDIRRRSPGRYVPRDRSVMPYSRDAPPRNRSRSRERTHAAGRMEVSSHYVPQNQVTRPNETRLAPVRDRDRRVDARDRNRETTRRSVDSRAADRRAYEVRVRERRVLDARERDSRRVDSRDRNQRVDADSRDRNKYFRRSRSASSSLPVDPRRRRRRSDSDSSSHSSASSGSSSGSSSGRKSGRSSSRSRSSGSTGSSSRSHSREGKD